MRLFRLGGGVGLEVNGLEAKVALKEGLRSSRHVAGSGMVPMAYVMHAQNRRWSLPAPSGPRFFEPGPPPPLFLSNPLYFPVS